MMETPTNRGGDLSSNHPRLTGFRGCFSTPPGRIGIAQFAPSCHRGDGSRGDAETTGRDTNTHLEGKSCDKCSD